jgi:hypothetical protein
MVVTTNGRGGADVVGGVVVGAVRAVEGETARLDVEPGTVAGAGRLVDGLGGAWAAWTLPHDEAASITAATPASTRASGRTFRFS